MSGTKRIDDNLEREEDGTVYCCHCRAVVAFPGESTLQRALVRIEAISAAGPQIRAGVPVFVNEPVEFRQRICPGCHAALLTEVVAASDENTRLTVLD